MIIDLSNKLKSTNILEDIFTNQVDRGCYCKPEYAIKHNDCSTDGFANASSNINFNTEPGRYNVYFYRYIGYETENKYNNNLLLLNKNIEKNPDNILLFKSSIPTPFDQNLTLSIMNELLKMDINNLDKEDINLVNDSEINTRIRKALAIVVPLAIEKEKFTNSNILYNFITKIMIWSNEFLSNIKWFNGNTPKAIFYGSIKRHEAYFLIMLSLIGFDVLYINSFEDSIFEDIDGDERFSYSLNNPIKGAIKNYELRVSMGEDIPVVTTVAQKANKEIEGAIFNSETGVFKPWQFINGITYPVLLNSTIDEVGIYWEQASKLRPGFKVEGDIVYIPNFFAKINGVNADISEYYVLISKLKQAKLNFFTEKVGIIEPKWTKQQMFSLAFVMNNNGQTTKEELVKHELYKYEGLNKETQNFIINKINEVLDTPSLFVNGIDTNMRLQIVATLLSMPEQILRLIEGFDYTGQIPKIVIYLKDKTDFTEEDTILFAFLNRVGADIVILSPCGANNVEKTISSTYITEHRLDEMVFDLELNDINVKHKRSFLEKLFK